MDSLGELIGELENFDSTDRELLDEKIKELLSAAKWRFLLKFFIIRCVNKFDSVTEAFAVYKPGQILIAFDEIHKYGIFDSMSILHGFMADYRGIYGVHECNENNCSDSEMIDPEPVQLIKTSEPQKLVFMCTPNRLTEIIEFIRKYLAVDASVTVIGGNVFQITVEKICRDRRHARTMFRKLIQCIEQIDPQCCDCIFELVERSQHDGEFTINYTRVSRFC